MKVQLHPDQHAVAERLENSLPTVAITAQSSPILYRVTRGATNTTNTPNTVVEKDNVGANATTRCTTSAVSTTSDLPAVNVTLPATSNSSEVASEPDRQPRSWLQSAAEPVPTSERCMNANSRHLKCSKGESFAFCSEFGLDYCLVVPRDKLVNHFVIACVLPFDGLGLNPADNEMFKVKCRHRKAWLVASFKQ